LRRADVVGSALLLTFSLLMLLVVIPSEVSEGQWYGLSPYAYPNLICGALALFSLLLLAQAIFKKNHYEAVQQKILSLFQVFIFVLLVVVITSGVWLISVLGVLVGGPLLIISIALIMGEKRFWVLLLSSTLPVLTIYGLAIYVLKTPLP